MPEWAVHYSCYGEKEMILRNAIGIDPDSKGFQCALVKLGEAHALQKDYLATEEGMESFIRWVKKHRDSIVAIEGSNGLSAPIEKALRDAEIVFYSFKACDVSKFRSVVLGQNKNNEKDAESTARYAMALEAQEKLDRWKRVWQPDEELRGLTRLYSQKKKEVTREANRLWKHLRAASVDLYLALGGRHPEIEIHGNILQNGAILALLAEKPDIYEWKTLSAADFITAMGGPNYDGRKKLIEQLQKVSKAFRPVSPVISMMIKNGAAQIMLMKQHLREINNMIVKLTKDNKAVQALSQHKGIGIMTSSIINAEIIDIRRFVNDDTLASYSGLARRQYSTGDNDKEISSGFYNRRLKDAFMTAARNFVIYNPDSHLAGYYRNLVKGGMKKNEARKRVARALVRLFFRQLYMNVELDNLDLTELIRKGGERDMANGKSRSDKDHSNISPSSPKKNNIICDEKVKREKQRLNYDSKVMGVTRKL